MLNFRIFMVTVCIFSLTGCSSVRMAIYDYQTRNTYAAKRMEETSATSMSSTQKAKKALTDTAEKYIGSRYRYGSCEPGKGFDCSGLVYHVARSHDILLPRSSSSMAGAGSHISWKKAEPGDLIFFGEGSRINHVGIVEKNKGDEIWIIHSSSTSGVIREDIMESDYWKKRVMFAIDIISSKERENVRT